MLNNLLVPIVATGSIYALIATGFNVLERSTKILNFAHGDLVMWYPLAALYGRQRGLPAYVAFTIALAFVILLAIVEERLAIAPFLRDRSSLPWIISTIGASLLIQQLATLPFRGETRNFPYLLVPATLHIAGLSVSSSNLSVIVAALVVVPCVVAFTRLTKVGKRMLAVADDVDGAAAIGIDPGRVSLQSAILAAVIAAITGYAVAPITFIYPTLGTTLAFTGFVAVSFGGFGSLPGGVLGGLVVGAVIQVVGSYVGSLWVNPILFGLLLLVFAVRPQGVLGATRLRTV